jgi:hypothetical protein
VRKVTDVRNIVAYVTDDAALLSTMAVKDGARLPHAAHIDRAQAPDMNRIAAQHIASSKASGAMASMTRVLSKGLAAAPSKLVERAMDVTYRKDLEDGRKDLFEVGRAARPFGGPSGADRVLLRGNGTSAAVLILRLALALVLAAATRGGGEFSGEALRRLEAGEIVTWTRAVAGRPVPWVKASGIVAAPPVAVWPIIDDCKRYEDTTPKTLESEELERHGERVICRWKGDLPFPFADLLTETDAVHTVEPGKVYRREWKQRSGDYAVNEGRWTLVPWRDGSSTLATYEALIEPRIALPDFIIRWGIRSILPDMIATLREQAKMRRVPSSGSAVHVP